MDKRKVFLPQGVQDLLIDDCLLRRKMEDHLMETFNQWGYMEVSSPTLEYYDLFTKPPMLADGDNMFKMIDTNGKILVMRPDCTIPIARMVATKMKNFVYPLKLCYVENVYRIDKEQSDQKREFRQAGVELFGVSSVKGDAEILVTAIESLKSMGLENLTVELGHMKFLGAVFDSLQLDRDLKQQLLRLLEEKNITGIKELTEIHGVDQAMAQLLTRLPRMFGTPREVLSEAKKYDLTSEMKEALEELQKTIEMVQEYGLGECLGIDLGMVSQLEYYTGITFKGFTKDLGAVILSGGRYDKLLGKFGMDCTATGFAIVVNKLTKALKRQRNIEVPRRKHILILDSQYRAGAVKEAVDDLRQGGNIVEFCMLEDREEIREYMERRQVDELVRIHVDGHIENISIHESSENR
ncbi:ATP phosphoribosyltransferase regulatory subunit [Tindallia magadiensis]|uniref:ATP phosphoribosyltransferase regulatory subunit n=1 Tax=Tindallia magadiensis TaxID=69895 RepID=A0A1I3DWR5_9FIRM|nr:ATP phosphoribosyltransferase regulatory subunit [Tindallia magadiensis]SFH91172.1 ATP phosphoribosyltransferase regulatory subunit [Tindallia magadiensis]